MALHQAQLSQSEQRLVIISTTFLPAFDKGGTTIAVYGSFLSQTHMSNSVAFMFLSVENMTPVAKLLTPLSKSVVKFFSSPLKLD